MQNTYSNSYSNGRNPRYHPAPPPKTHCDLCSWRLPHHKPRCPLDFSLPRPLAPQAETRPHPLDAESTTTAVGARSRSRSHHRHRRTHEEEQQRWREEPQRQTRTQREMDRAAAELEARQRELSRQRQRDDSGMRNNRPRVPELRRRQSLPSMQQQQTWILPVLVPPDTPTPPTAEYLERLRMERQMRLQRREWDEFNRQFGFYETGCWDAQYGSSRPPWVPRSVLQMPGEEDHEYDIAERVRRRYRSRHQL